MTSNSHSPVVADAAATAIASSDSSPATHSHHAAGSSLPSVANEAVLEALVTKVVNETLFTKKQFVVLERELDATSKVAKTCLSAMKLEKERWDSIKNMVRKRLNRRRNNAQLCVRRSLCRKCSALSCCIAVTTVL
jgi:hypothetical protein